MALLSCLSCSPRAKREVVVYTSVDLIYSEPFFRQFEQDTGITVKPKYDIEAAKTIGLVNALIDQPPMFVPLAMLVPGRRPAV